MSANRIHYFIRSILQNSKLNREKFVNNKKKYNMMSIKNRNHNKIIKRNFSLNVDYTPPNKNPNDNSSYFIALGSMIGVYLINRHR
jgi:hypothetical protein